MNTENQKPIPEISPEELQGAVGRVMGSASGSDRSTEVTAGLDETPEQEPQPMPYEDPALISEAAGDARYLDRLVGVKIAERMLSQSPDDEGLRQNLDFMKEALEVYKNSKP